MTSKPLKIFFQSIDAAGHLSACYGFAQALVERGHQVTFFLSPAFSGQAAKFGCKEVIFKTTKSAEKAAAEQTGNPVEMIANQLLSTGMLGPKSSFEKMKIKTDVFFFEHFLDEAIERNDQITAAILSEKPDLFILDSFLILPVIQKLVPYINIFSANPLLLYDSPKLPPGCSGYQTNSDPKSWSDFATHFREKYVPMLGDLQVKLDAHYGYTPVPKPEIPNMQKFRKSPFLNIYGFPKELDYQEIVPLPPNFIQIDAFCRQEAAHFTIPEELESIPGKALIYFSMGSMGGIDVNLMKRLLAIFAKTPYKYIVSKGPRHAEFDLPPNCWGAAHLPQTAILPLVDLVITHGGNNSFTETFSFGKKMIVLPLFSDQYDNGARIVEKGYGATFNPYDFEEEKLLEAMERLLNDDQLTLKLKDVRDRIVRDNSKVKACEAIEAALSKLN